MCVYVLVIERTLTEAHANRNTCFANAVIGNENKTYNKQQINTKLFK